MIYYDKKKAGERIKFVRKEMSLTQEELAERLVYGSARQLRRIVNGETVCSVDRLMEIAQILGVSTDYILFGTKDGNRG